MQQDHSLHRRLLPRVACGPQWPALTIRLWPDILPGSSLPLTHGLNPDSSPQQVPPAQGLTGTTCWEGSSASVPYQLGLIITITKPRLGFPCPLDLAYRMSRLGQYL